MLLRRITEHVQKQNWLAVAIDFLIVVVGVFIGIQVANWNEARSEREDEAGYLRAMAQDVRSSVDKARQILVTMERQQGDRATLLSYSASGDWSISGDKLDALILNGLFFSTPLSISHVTFETLKTSGQLGLIGSRRLQAELQSLDTRITDLHAFQEDEIVIVQSLSDPMLVEHFDLRSVFQAYPNSDERRLTWLPSHSATDEIPALVRSAAFANVLIFRSYLAQSKIRALEVIVEQEKRIEQLISERLRVLGAREEEARREQEEAGGQEERQESLQKALSQSKKENAELEAKAAEAEAGAQEQEADDQAA